MRGLKIFAGILAVMFLGFIGYVIYLVTGYEDEKNKARTKNATLARWPKQTENGQAIEDDLNELQKTADENQQ